MPSFFIGLRAIACYLQHGTVTVNTVKSGSKYAPEAKDVCVLRDVPVARGHFYGIMASGVQTGCTVKQSELVPNVPMSRVRLSWMTHWPCCLRHACMG